MTTLDTIHSSVRPVVTYSLTAALIVGFFLHMIPGDVFSSLVISVVSYWFGSRERSVPNEATLPVTTATSDTVTTVHAESDQEEHV